MGREFNIPWIGGSIYHGEGDKTLVAGRGGHIIMDRGQNIIDSGVKIPRSAGSKYRG